METKAILIKEQDTVATALVLIEAGQEVAIRAGDGQILIRVKEQIPFGHKFAIRDISKSEDIIKYGEIIGRATEDIQAGRHAHIQNIESLRGRGDWNREDR